ncbi:hypothetical protein IAU59_005449 [Kwoniella sp. CBS 9459]
MPGPQRTTRIRSTNNDKQSSKSNTNKHIKNTVSKEYASDEADVTLVSTDGVKFKVHSYMLKAHSGFFRDMMTDPGFSPTPCDMDATSIDLKFFLDLIHRPDCPGLKDWNQAESVLKMCDKYDCWTTSRLLRDKIILLLKVNPWKIFCYASQCDDLQLAREALKNMSHDPDHSKLDVSSIPANEAAKVAPAYLVSVLSEINDEQFALYQETGVMESADSDEVEDFWKRVAKYFSPRT